MYYYTVAFASGQMLANVTQELEKKVEDLLKKGWRLQGGVSIVFMPNNAYFVVSQALVK